MPRIRWNKILLFLLCLAPLFALAWRVWNEDLTANPTEFIQHFMGDWAIRLIVATLAITPLRKLLGAPGLVRFRRMIGLFAFFYACLHVLTYLWLDKLFDFPAMVKDVSRRPFITAGFAAFACLVPLALTSTAGWIRRLGGKRWQRLHRLVYVTAIAAVAHYYWFGEIRHSPADALRHPGRPSALLARGFPGHPQRRRADDLASGLRQAE